MAKIVKLEQALEYAKRLREVGVTHVKVTGLEMNLEPYRPEAEQEGGALDAMPDIPGGPLDSPDLYGRNDGYVPGFERLRNRKSEDE